MKKNTQEKSLQLTEANGIFFKIKNFFKKFINKENLDIIDLEDVKSNVEDETKSEFLKDIKIDVNVELLNIQNKLKNSEISVRELTEEQIDKLIILYNKQIADKKERLSNIKQKIITTKSSLKIN